MGIETAKELNILKIAESVKFVNNKEHYMNSVDNKSVEAEQRSNLCKNIDDKIKLPMNQNDNSFEHIDSNCKVTLKFKNNLTKLIAKYEDIFEGHVAQNLRRYPYHLRKDIRAELKRLQEADIIEKVVGPQELISNFVIVPKANKTVKLCLDARTINKAIKRERYPISTLDSVIDEMHGSKIFAKLDMKEAYTQLELNIES
ncbi:uncharacterized protein LOC124815996 [Hydra vulgaris]|uniref:uncharacterized protein LOC124815996 n=1 Tax=Hydra vulgaris TaxID=6087 RepID=UPI001F5E591D|nr:uncharacterized protein LOC124815996 [Hydra vulgaris]